MSDAATPPAEFTVGLVQMACGEAVSTSLDTASTLIEQAADHGAQVI